MTARNLDPRREDRPAPLGIRLAAAMIRHLPAGRYQALQRVARPAPPPFVAHLPKRAGGFAFHCDLRDGIAREVCFTGAYEPLETALVRALLPAGGTFVDVGANWGYFTLLGAHLVGSGGRVVALEPDPRLFGRLESNVDRNHLAHVTPLQLAAADSNGTLTLSGFDEADANWGVSSLNLDAPADGPRPAFDVETAALDDVFDEQRIDAADLVKVDVEGAETLVIRGMERGIERGRYRALLVELHPSLIDGFAAFERALRDRMAGAGYRGWWIDHSPDAARRAAYARRLDPRPFLRPVSAGAAADADAWPHQLWLHSSCTFTP